jgi:hypothetical protein
MLRMPRQSRSFSFIDKSELLKLKTKAMRSGAWFKALRRIDRVLVDLTIKVASTIRSITLAKSILTVTRKLQELLESDLARAMRGIGFPTAKKLSRFAQRWGNTNARGWVSDVRFVRYLAIMKLYGHPLTVAGGK